MKSWCPPLLLLIVSACQVDSHLPDRVVVTCERNADCPAGFACRAAIGRCVANDVDDVAGPTVEVLELAPTAATVGTPVHLRLSVSEELGARPEARFGDDGTRFIEDDNEIALDAGEFAFTHIVTGSTDEGVVAVNLRVIDAYGNETVMVAGTVTVDFAPPTVTGLGWLLAAGQSQTTGAETLHYAAAVESGAQLVTARLLRSASGPPIDVAAGVLLTALPGGDQQLAGQIVLTGSEVIHGESVDVELVFRDAAGNQNAAGAVRTPPLLVDGVPPSGLAISYDGPVPSQSRDVSVAVTALGAAELRLGGDIVSPLTWQAVALPTTLLVTLTAGDGAKTVTVEVRDAAFHTVGPQAVVIAYTANFDTAGPQVQAVTAEGPRAARVLFDEPVGATAANNLSSYSMVRLPGGSDDPVILGCQLAADAQSVLLFVDRDFVGQAAYRLTTTGLADLLGQLLDPNPTLTDFAGYGSAPDPSPPDILGPAANVALRDLTPTLSWTARTGSDAYDLEIATDAGFSSLVEARTLTATSFTAATALGDRTYYWRVRSHVPPQTWAASSVELVGDVLYVACATAETCDDSAGDRYGNRTKPLRTINRAVATANHFGIPEVHVAGGGEEYVEMVALPTGLALRGGYQAPAWTRPALETIVRAPAGHPAAIVAIGITTPTVIDGLRLVASTSYDATALTITGCDNNLSVIDCTIEAPDHDGHAVSQTAAVLIGSSGATGGAMAFSGPLLRNNVIRGSSRSEQSGGASRTYGVLIDNSSPHLDRNTIFGGDSDLFTSGVSLRYGGQPALTNNLIVGGSELSLGTSCIGLELLGSYTTPLPAIVTNNTIVTGNCSATPSAGQWAVAFQYSAAALINNLLVTRNTGATEHCLHRTLNMVTDLARVEKNGMVNCGCAFYDGSACQADPQAAGYVTTWVHPFTATTAAFVNAGTDDFHLLGTAPVALRRYGRDTRSGTCNGTSCGDVTRDRDNAVRSCSVAPAASGTIAATTNCLSVGAYEY